MTRPSTTITDQTWNTFRDGDTVTASEFIAALAVLLDAVVFRLDGVGVEQLLANIRSSLDTSGRESVLRIADLAYEDGVRHELATQAKSIGAIFADWVSASLTSPRERTDGADRVDVRSHCDGHLLTPEVAYLLLGPTGSASAMQMFNEWLHQIVLLRDALLPFDNWEDVPLTVDRSGLRRIESARDRFLAELLTRKVKHTSLVAFARETVTGVDTAVAKIAGYGFAAHGGHALPSVLNGTPASSPRYLLRWTSERVAGLPSDISTVFTYAVDDYYSAPRTDLPQTFAVHDAVTLSAALTAHPAPDTDNDHTTQLSIHVEADGTRIADLDVGQALRGHRYSYLPSGHAPATGLPSDAVGPSAPIGASDLLALNDLVWARSGVAVIDAGQDPLVGLAVLARIFPENVVVWTDEPWPNVLAAGKPGRAKFVVKTVADASGYSPA